MRGFPAFCGIMQIEKFHGARIAGIVPAVARLRIAVFREWPYLYDGDTAYEERYLRTYTASPSAAVFVAFDKVDPVGASTCIRLSEERPNIVQPLRDAGHDPAKICYFGESVLLPRFRGGGLGVRFFALREAHAGTLGCSMAAFCAVQRPKDHPARATDFVPLDHFWRQRGFEERPDCTCEIAWKEIGEARETSKRMVFWTKQLR